jgi:hypothetical protein
MAQTMRRPATGTGEARASSRPGARRILLQSRQFPTQQLLFVEQGRNLGRVVAAVGPQQAAETPQFVVLAPDHLLRDIAGHRLDAPDSGRDAAFARDAEGTDVAGGQAVGAAAQFEREQRTCVGGRARHGLGHHRGSR